MKQQTMVAMAATKSRMDEAMPARVEGLRGGGQKTSLMSSNTFSNGFSRLR